MRYTWLASLWLILLLVVPDGAVAQDRGGRPSRDSMRAQVERRFAARVQQELQLTDDQASRLESTMDQYANRRKELRDRERDLRAALAGQLRPGVAADNDSVAHLTDELIGLRLRFVESFRDELEDMSAYLTPVQRARLFTMRERLFHAAQRMRERRQGDRPMVRPRDGRRR